MTSCPCGTGRPYDACCGAFHADRSRPRTAEQVMRARYAAFVLGDEAFLLRTWHESTRPARITFDPHLTWTGLDVLATTGGSAFERSGTVEFVATATRQRGRRSTPVRMHEISTFVVTDRWVYLDGDVGGES